MWKAKLKIIDEVAGEEKEIIYKLIKIFRYIDLYKKLPELYPMNLNISSVSFTFRYLEKDVLVDDLNKYILNNDYIIIHIRKKKPVYFLFDPFERKNIYSSYDISNLYSYHLKYTLNYEMLLFGIFGVKEKLIDVLDNPQIHYNQCLNRLIHRYNF
jgi:hypothetical protein